MSLRIENIRIALLDSDLCCDASLEIIFWIHCCWIVIVPKTIPTFTENLFLGLPLVGSVGLLLNNCFEASALLVVWEQWSQSEHETPDE